MAKVKMQIFSNLTKDDGKILKAQDPILRSYININDVLPFPIREIVVFLRGGEKENREREREREM